MASTGWLSWWTGRGIRTRSCWPTPEHHDLAGLATPLAVDELIGAGGGAGPGGSGDAPLRGAAPRHHPGQRRASPATAPRAWWTSRWPRPSPSCARGSPTTARSWGRWPTWRRSPPGAPAGRWTSGPTCTRWARRCTRLATGAPPFGTGDPLRPDPRSSGPGAGAAGGAEPGRPGGAVADHPASAGEGAGPPLPDAPTACCTTWSGCGTPTRRRRAVLADRRARSPAAAAAAVAAGRPRGRRGRSLEAAFEEALAGRCRAVLVGGAPGVGKTVLVDQLRPVVTGGDGWFVAGKFDQYRRDLEFDGVAPGLPRAGPAAAGRAGGRARRRPRADPAPRSGRTRGWPPRCCRSSPRCWRCRRMPVIR